MNSVSKSQWCILASYYFCCCRCLKATNKFSCKKKTFIWLLLFFSSFCAIACTICADRIHDICFWIHALARCAYAYSNIWCYRLKSFLIVIISWLSSTLVNDGFSGFGIYLVYIFFFFFSTCRRESHTSSIERNSMWSAIIRHFWNCFRFFQRGNQHVNRGLGDCLFVGTWFFFIVSRCLFRCGWN